MKNALQFIPKTADVALRGNTANVCAHIANGRSTGTLSRREVIAKVNAENARAELIAGVRRSFEGSTRRVGLVMPCGQTGAHVVGLGFIPANAFSPRELAMKLARFTHLRVRGSNELLAV